MGPKGLPALGKKSNHRWPLYFLCAVLIAAAAYLRNYNCLNSLRMDTDTALAAHIGSIGAPRMFESFDPVRVTLSRMIVRAKDFRNPWDLRRFMLLLMSIDALLVFIIAISLGLRLRWGLAAGLTYLLYPIHNSNWSISATSHYLVAAFTMAGFLIHLEARRNGMTALRLLGLAASCALSFGSKESGLVFPALVWSYDLLVPTKGAGRTAAGRYLENGVLIGLALGYLAFRWAFFRQADLSAAAAAISPGYTWGRLLRALFMVRIPLIAACLAFLASGMSGKIAPIAMRRSCFFGSWFLIGMLVYLAAPDHLQAFSDRYLVFPFAGVAWLVGASLDECESKLGPRWTGGIALAVFCPMLLSPTLLCEDRASQLRGIEYGLSLCGGSESRKGDCLMSALSLPLVREKDYSAYQKFVYDLRRILSPDAAGSFLRFFEIDLRSRDAGRSDLLMETLGRMSDPGNPASFSEEAAEYGRAADLRAPPPENVLEGRRSPENAEPSIKR